MILNGGNHGGEEVEILPTTIEGWKYNEEGNFIGIE